LTEQEAEVKAVSESAEVKPRTFAVKRRKSRLRNANFVRLLSAVAFVVVWQIVGMATTPLFLPTPMEVINAIPTVYTQGALIANTTASLKILSIGFLLSVAIGVPLGIVIGRYHFAELFSDIYINVFYALPAVALIPLLMVWFGIGDTSKIVIVFLSGFFPILLNTGAGVHNIDHTLVEVARSLGARESELSRKIVLPGSVPFIMTGLRIAIGRAIVGLIVAELFLSLTGLGAMLAEYEANFHTADYFVPLLIIAAISVFMTEAVKHIESRFSSWRVSPINR
jgi:NitT/TauT family transport system permease protein